MSSASLPSNDTPYLSEAPYDWDEIISAWDAICFDLEPYILPTTELEMAHRLSFKQSTFSPLITRNNWGQMDWPVPRRMQERLSDFNTTLASDLTVRCFAIIRSAVTKRQLSPQFVIAWGHVMALSDRRRQLRLMEDEFQRTFESGIEAGLGQSKLQQQIWYAKWLLQNVPGLEKAPREDAEDSLARECFRIVRGRRNCPAGFDPSWFALIISDEASDKKSGRPNAITRSTKAKDVLIADHSFRRLVPKQIREFAAFPDAWVRLPPLDL